MVENVIKMYSISNQNNPIIPNLLKIAQQSQFQPYYWQPLEITQPINVTN